MAQSSNGIEPGEFALTQGRWLVGTYLGLRDQAPRTQTYGDREVTYHGCDIGLRIDGELVTVGVIDRETAEGVVAGWETGEERAVKVRILGGANARGGWVLFNLDGARVVGTAGFAAPGS